MRGQAECTGPWLQDGARGSSFVPYTGGVRPSSRFGLALLLAAVTAVYAPTLNDYFGGDDFLVIGPVSRLGAGELIWRSFLMRDDIPYWRPLVSPLYALAVHGFWLRPMPYHLVVLGLHLLNAALLVAVATALTGRHGVGLAAGLLFGIHAAHTTTVAQISSMVELFSVVWYLSAVLGAVRFAAVATEGGQRARRWYVLALGAFVLALLSKESTVSAAAVISLWWCLTLYRPHGARWLAPRLLPFWLLAVPYTVFAYLTDTDDPSGIARHMYFPGLHVLPNLWWFLARLALPLTPGHGPHVSTAGHAGAALLAVLFGWALLRGPRHARFLVLWTGIALTPLALWRPELLLGRFTYQAAAPYGVLLALAGHRVVNSLVGPSGRLAPHLPAVRREALLGGALVVVAAALLAPLTVAQNRERTREGDSYHLLVTALRHEVPLPPAQGTIVLVDGVWLGPFHALYLGAVAETLYGRGRVRVVNVAPGEPVPAVEGPAVHLRYTGGGLVREAR